MVTAVPLNLTRRSVSRHDERALHHQLAELIREAIANGTLRPGEELPSEDDIADDVAVSRTAVRNAMDALSAEGLVVKRAGARTRVATPPPVRHMATTRYADELAILRGLDDVAKHPESSAFTADHRIGWDAYEVFADYAEDQATAADAEHLDIPQGTAVLRRQLVKYAAGTPVQVQESVMPLALVADTAVADSANQPWPGGTIAELYSIGLVVCRVTEEVRARTASVAERRQLEMEAAGPVFDIVRVFFVEQDGGERPAEASTVVAPAAGLVIGFETRL